jgi:hypothetical protein
MWDEKITVPAPLFGETMFVSEDGAPAWPLVRAALAAACAVLALGGLVAWVALAPGMQVQAHGEIAGGPPPVATRLANPETLDHLAELTEKRDELIRGQLHPLGAETRKLLAAINDGAHKAADHRSADYALRAQESFLLARLYAAKFIDTHDEDEIERVNAEFEELDRGLAALDASLADPERRRLLAAAAANLPRYKQAFEQVVEIVQARNRLRAEARGQAGPAARKSI